MVYDPKHFLGWVFIRPGFHTQPEKNLGRFPSGWGRGEEEAASLQEQSN